jgi:hypothetical protein
MSYDPKCEELAQHFLSDSTLSTRWVKELAQHIQDEIEFWIEDETRRIELNLKGGVF